MDKTQDIVELLKSYNQTHIIDLLNKLDGDKKQELIEQINKIDLHQIMELYENTKKEAEFKENKIEAITYYDKEKIDKNKKQQWDEIGEKIIKNGEWSSWTKRNF